jgi:hypothetical protein
MLRQLAPDLWVIERPLRFAGLEVGTRMSVIALEDGSLLLHSPLRPDPELREELDALGPVRFAVAPNRFHHLYVADCVSAYPELQCFCAPGLERKRSDIGWDGILGDEAPEAWAGQLDQIPFQGFPLANEVLFFHRSSRTLLAADLVYNVGAKAAPLTRLFFRLLGGYGRFGPTRLERLMIRDRSAARASLERILEWDFERVILAHGELLERGGPAALRAGYAWLLDGE